MNTKTNLLPFFISSKPKSNIPAQKKKKSGEENDTKETKKEREMTSNCHDLPSKSQLSINDLFTISLYFP